MTTRAGFTLLELLVALVVVIILAAAVVSSFATGLKAWDKMQEQADYHQTASALLDTIGGDLQEAWLGGNGKGFFKLETDAGGNTSLSFTTLAPVRDSEGLSQFVVIKYYVEGDQLLRSRQSLANFNSATAPSPEAEVVTDAVGAFKLRATGDDDWQEQWVVPAKTDSAVADALADIESALPKQVEINLSLNDSALGKSARLQSVVPIMMGHP